MKSLKDLMAEYESLARNSMNIYNTLRDVWL